VSDNRLIKFESNQLQRVDKTISITNKLLALGVRNEIIELFISHPDFFNRQVSQFYPFTNDQLKYCFGGLYTIYLAENNKIDWAIVKLSDYNTNERSWKIFIRNKNFPWSDLLLDSTLKNLEFDWYWLCSNTDIPWSENIIDHNFDKIAWSNLSENESLPWSTTFLAKYSKYLDWQSISRLKSIPWSESLIDQFIEKWDWNGMSSNEALPWDEPFVFKYFTLIQWSALSSNEKFPWSSEIFEEKKSELDWYLLSSNKGLPWSEYLVEQFRDLWDWFWLSRNEALPWTENLIDKHISLWDWKSLSENEALPFSLNFLVKYSEHWKYDSLGLLSIWTKELYYSFTKAISEPYGNDELLFEFGFSAISFKDWNEDLLDDIYIDEWDWSHLSSDTKVKFTEDLIEKYQQKWLWVFLGLQPNLPWSFSLLKKYEAKWVWPELGLKKYHGIDQFAELRKKCFENYVDADLIKEVLHRIGYKKKETATDMETLVEIANMSFAAVAGVSTETYSEIANHIKNSRKGIDAHYLLSQCREIAKSKNERITDEDFIMKSIQQHLRDA
jgi:hypothetical protein